MSNAAQYLTDMVTLAQSLLDDAAKGGARQKAFELCVNEMELSGAVSTLADLSAEIDGETEDAAITAAAEADPDNPPLDDAFASKARREQPGQEASAEVANHTYVYETQQFFEFEAEPGADPDEVIERPEARQHFMDLIESQFIEFKHERTLDENGYEV